MKRVLIGIDASPNARDALRWAIDNAEPGDRLELVHGWSVVAIAGLEAPHVNPALVEVEAHRLLREAADDVISDDDRERFDIVLTAVHRHPSQALIDLSAEADLVVLGRRGLGGFKALLLGSVSSDVVHHAACPVVVIPPAEVAEEAT